MHGICWWSNSSELISKQVHWWSLIKICQVRELSRPIRHGHKCSIDLRPRLASSSSSWFVSGSGRVWYLQMLMCIEFTVSLRPRGGLPWALRIPPPITYRLFVYVSRGTLERLAVMLKVSPSLNKNKVKLSHPNPSRNVRGVAFTRSYRYCLDKSHICQFTSESLKK
jgi:hypothetical protein